MTDRRLRGLAYRMLGSATDAEEVVQEAHARLAAQEPGSILEPDAWLTTVTSRLAIDRLREARRSRETYVGTWLPEPVLDEVDPAERVIERESVTLAFLVVLERLTPLERAAFLLHDVFGESHADTATALERSEAAVRKLVSRARERIQADRPRFEADRQQRDAVVEAFLAATETGQVESLVQLLSPDVRFVSDGGGRVAAARRPVTGSTDVARFVLGLLRRAGESTQLVRRQVNGEPGVLVWEQGSVTTAIAVHVVDGRIEAIHAVRNPDKLAHLAAGPDGQRPASTG